MNLMFFGDSGRQLFGAYHVPPATVAARGGAVLCPAWGPESLASHRILRRLAVRLSDNGYHVLRFDYYGTGDSGGNRDEGDLTSWYADASLAVDELRDMSGCTTVASFGIRLGAVMGWRLAATRTDVNTVVMWDPVVNGTDYVQSMIAAQLDIDRWSISPRRPRASADGTLDVLGFPLTPPMRTSIEGVALAEFQQPMRAQVKLFYSDMPPGGDGLHVALDGAGTSYETATMPGQTPWREDDAVGAGGLPFVVLERMVESLR